MSQEPEHEIHQEQEIKPEPEYIPEISQELKAFFRAHNYVNICMREGCIKKCYGEFCRRHATHTCAWPGCRRNIISKNKTLCGVHTPEARQRNVERVKQQRAEYKRLKEQQKLQEQKMQEDQK